MAILVVMSLADLLVSLHLMRQLEKLKILLFTILFFVLIVVITIPIMNSELKFSKLVTEANSCFSAKNYKKSAELYDYALSLSPIFKDIKSVRKNLSKAKILNESSNNFNEGMEHFKNKNYESAINEIGQGTYANGIKIPNDGWYRLEITAVTGYSWNFE